MASTLTCFAGVTRRCVTTKRKSHRYLHCQISLPIDPGRTRDVIETKESRLRHADERERRDVIEAAECASDCRSAGERVDAAAAQRQCAESAAQERQSAHASAASAASAAAQQQNSQVSARLDDHMLFKDNRVQSNHS